MSTPFEILFVLFPTVTQLDFAGPYEVFCRLPDVHVTACSPAGGDVETSHGVTYRGLPRLADIERCDLICVPGGVDQTHLTEPQALKHIRRLAEGAAYVTSVCTGSLVLAEAGLLQGRRSACHWAMRDQLTQFGAIPDPARVVRDGRFISGGGVTAGIDFALACAAEIATPVVAQAIQLLLEYAPEPPFCTGRPETAPPEVLQTAARVAV